MEALISVTAVSTCTCKLAPILGLQAHGLATLIKVVKLKLLVAPATPVTDASAPFTSTPLFTKIIII